MRSISFAAIALLVVACAGQTHVGPSDPHAGAAKSTALKTEAGDESADAEHAEEADEADTATGPCPTDMVLVADRVCVDKYEASLVETVDGVERAYPNNQPVDGHVVRAVSVPGVLPQGFISEVQAQDACSASEKRLCTHEEWKIACKGPENTTFPYGEARKPGACHDTGKSAVLAVFGAKAVAASTPGPGVGNTVAAVHHPHAAPVDKNAPTATRRVAEREERLQKTTGTSGKDRKAHATKGRAASSGHARASKKDRAAAHDKDKHAKAGTKPLRDERTAPKAAGVAAKKSAKPASVDPGVWAKLNDPRLGTVDGALSKTGDHATCVNGWGVYDMVGNLHEWVATDTSLPHGTFAGGYYLDTAINGDGCNYRTVAHAHDYHDYSTGFRCCADPKK